MEQGSELFEYTSGRWIQSWNDAFKHSERRRLFNISELKHLAASAVDRSPGDVARFEKLGEGGFNRSFLITMRDGFQLVGRIPYTTTEPKQLVIASEVATMDFLRMHGIPVPKIYSYSATSENPAGTEYIFMELVQGTNLGDIWFDLPEKARITVVTRLVELESRLFALPFSASGSLYYTKDLDINIRKAGVTTTNTSARGSFCIGPDTRLCLWYGKRSRLNLDRGPFTDPAAVLAAGAKKEIAYLTNTLRRKLFDHASSPWEGDNITLKADLIELAQNWSDVIKSHSNTGNDANPLCPVRFSEEDMKHTLDLNAAQLEADEQLQACRDVIGIGPEGWVPLDQYNEVKQRESKLKADALEAAESDQERLMLQEHWIFDDFDEDEYS
ncbi:hypothetical protein E8E11_006321 [Didymella keratinophila]|nr:hypothetical protein E8E11_006321 [Didymella keratinophila]